MKVTARLYQKFGLKLKTICYSRIGYNSVTNRVFYNKKVVINDNLTSIINEKMYKRFNTNRNFFNKRNDYKKANC